MTIYSYIVEIDSGDGGKEEATSAYLGSALYHEFGDGFKLFTKEGKQVLYDAKAADYEHPGHNVIVQVVEDEAKAGAVPIKNDVCCFCKYVITSVDGSPWQDSGGSDICTYRTANSKMIKHHIPNSELPEV